MSSMISTQLPKTSASQDLMSMLRSPANGANLGAVAQDFARALDQSQANRQLERTTQADNRRLEQAANNRERTPSPESSSALNSQRKQVEPLRQHKTERTSEPNTERDDQPHSAQSPSSDNTQTRSDTTGHDSASAHSAKSAQAGEADATEASTAAAEAGLPASLAALSSIVAALNQGDQKAIGEALDELAGTLDDMPDALKTWLGQLASGDGKGQGASEDGKALLAELKALADKGEAAQQRGETKLNQSATFQQVIQLAQSASNLATGQNSAAPLHSVQADPSGENLAATLHGTSSTRPTQSVQQLPVYTPAGQKPWAEDVSNRLIWMSNRGETKAELVLTPPTLGKLGVSLQINGEHTTAHFVAATAAARDALEQAMPRLREILQQSGIQLGQADVSTASEQQAREEHNGGRGSNGRHHGSANLASQVNDPGAASAQWHSTSSLSAVDTFA